MIKNKVTLNNVILIFFIIFTFITFFFIYIQYNKSKEILIQSYIDKYSLQSLQIKEKFKNVFDKALYTFKMHENEDLKKLYLLSKLYQQKKDLKYISEILNKDVKKGFYEISLIDRNYRIVNSTYKPELNYDLGKFPAYRKILDSVFKGESSIDVSYVHLDMASMNLKKYYLIRSYDNKYLLELAYVIDICDSLKKVYSSVSPSVKDIELFFLDKYMIYQILVDHTDKKKKDSVTEIYVNSIKILHKIVGGKKISDKKLFAYVMGLFKKNENIIKQLDFKHNNLIIYMLIDSVFAQPENKIIIETEYDISKLKEDLNKLLNNLLLTYVLMILITMVMYMIIIHRSSQTLLKLVSHMKKNKPCPNCESFIKEIDEVKETYNTLHYKLNKEIEKNRKLLESNRRFILDTIHQIRTPLNVIMLNTDLLKMELKDKNVEEIIEEIDAAVAMLTNSYEDLAYLSSNNTAITYKPSLINISEILKSRINFFATIAKVNDKKLISDIEENVSYFINRIEFERIVDNNISNAIKYSLEEEIFVSLKKEGDKIVLRFESYGEKIENPVKIFEKNYREQTHKRGLGLGLNIVKNICDKYSITYKVFYRDEKNVFEYVFKI